MAEIRAVTYLGHKDEEIVNIFGVRRRTTNLVSLLEQSRIFRDGFGCAHGVCPLFICEKNYEINHEVGITGPKWHEIKTAVIIFHNMQR
jgi:hypothetical protein